MAIDHDGGLASPTVGTWRPALSRGALVEPGTVLGHLRRLGRWIELRAPEGVHGQATELAPAWTEAQWGTALVKLGTVEGQGSVAVSAEQAVGLKPLRAPMAGAVWLRPSPAAPSFVNTGTELQKMATLALIEVMKTFTPIRAEEACVVERWTVKDGQAVEAGQVIAWLR